MASIEVQLRDEMVGSGPVCRRILHALPAWFGVPESVEDYVAAADRLPTVIASIGGEDVGILSWLVRTPFAAEVHVMGVLPEHHHQGIGRRLLDRAEHSLMKDGMEFLQVKTLSPSSSDEGYEKTRAFYLSCGFRPLEEFPALWGSENPALQMIKKLTKSSSGLGQPRRRARRRWQTWLADMSENYDALAYDYDWLFSDEMLVSGLAVAQPATASLLSQLGSEHRVLDAACGTGVDTAVVARHGLSMWAADKSPAMIDHARLRFASEGLTIPLLQGEWAQLPNITEERFDAVLCIGNSLVHAAGKDGMVRALMGLRGVLKPRGAVVVDSRNWEKLHSQRPVVQLAENVVVRDGQRCISLYAWEIPEQFEDVHVAHLVFVFDDGATVTSRKHRFGFQPFTVEQLRERLRAAGLHEVETDFDPQSDRYSIVAIPG
jgi:SAM-dependent methyltransferase/GNAT superfamily N-acetyltransferase